jgi:hypothetical protein
MCALERLTKDGLVGGEKVACGELYAQVRERGSFSGIPAAVLIWWSWKSNQERLIVQKLMWYFNKLGGSGVLLRDNLGPVFQILEPLPRVR